MYILYSTASQEVETPIVTLVEDIRPVLMKNYEFEYGDLSKLFALLAFSDYQNTDGKNKIIYY